MFTNALARVIQKGGELVSDEQGKARLEVCKGCEKYGTVEAVPGKKEIGCTECGCPLNTKAFSKFIVREKGAEGSFKPHEILTREFRGEKVKVKCPLGKWEKVDKTFENGHN